MEISGGPLGRQNERSPLAEVQLSENENQTVGAFVEASNLYAKFDCPVVRLNSSLLANAHDCESSL